jgi:hypothetical protein
MKEEGRRKKEKGKRKKEEKICQVYDGGLELKRTR